ncbi:peptidase M50B-like-domain-containing protein [Flagelloscypha sp. PMI_526]|nr:peptidase M50B-like-domain-containing protein [Flagelloscypha sp. PMI_526]
MDGTVAPRPPVASALPSATPSDPQIIGITPTSDQVVVLYVSLAMAVVIFGFWNVPVIRTLINPLKLFTIGFHELSHVIAAILSGGQILKITIDPYVGGATIVEGGIPGFILTSGYTGSTIVGACFLLAGWNILAAKIMSWVLAIGLLLPLVLVRDKITILLTFFYEALLIGFWFIDHGGGLRWYCLFMGVMNIFYAIWDVADDRYFQKTNDSDATQFALLYPGTTAHFWASIWITFQLAFFAGFAVLGIECLKLSHDAQVLEASKFLPT